jgi:hypothetical protein
MVPVAALAQGRTLCALDNLNNTVVIKTDTDFAAGAIVGLHGWLSIGQATIPIHGTAVVNAAGANAKISLQGINTAERHQHLGIAVDTDLMLNGSGTFDNVTAGRPFTYEIIPVTWTALDPCPGPPQFAQLAQDAGQTANAGKRMAQTGGRQ